VLDKTGSLAVSFPVQITYRTLLYRIWCLLLAGQWTFIGTEAEAEWIWFSGWVCKWFAAGYRWPAWS